MTVASLEIAGVRVDLGLSGPGARLPRRYQLFAGAGGAARWSISLLGPLTESGPEQIPPARHVVEVGGLWRVPGGETEGWLDPSSRRGEARGGGILDTLIRAAVGWDVLARGGLLVHAVAVEVDGGAHLCPARSGSGKSTLAARAGHPLSDEMSILIPGDGWVAYATPWWTSRGGRAPLVRVYELAWNGEAVVPLPGNPLRHLLSQLALVLDTPELRARALAAAAAVARAVPMARLVFRPDSDVDALLRAGPLR